jgi:hypothetical protein
MELYRRNRQIASSYLGYLALSAALTLAGCASPGPPHAPSLQLPQPVRDLTAQRIGNSVELHFTAPSNSTDKLPLLGSTLTGQLCRQLPHQPCLPASPRTSIPITNSNDTHNLVTWTDTLPTSLTEGPPQLLAYRVEFFSPANRSAGPSNQAFTASSQAPAPVENLQGSGSRLGILLQWTPSPGEVVFQREDLSPSKPKKKKDIATPNTSKPTLIWLQTHPPNSPQTNQTLDTSALPDTPYRYTAERRLTVHLGPQTVILRSFPSTPISFILKQIYSPPTPAGLTAAGYSSGTPSAYAIDLIWQPVNEAGLITPLAGYNLYREALGAAGQPTSNHQQMNTLPISQPAFHDPTANPATTYRYSVTAIDTQGNQSPAMTVVVPPSA